MAGPSQSAHDADIVQSAWNLESLAGAYTDFVACYQPILDALRQSAPEGVDEQSAFLVRMLLIHDFRRLLLRDPELPEVSPSSAGQAMRRASCARRSSPPARAVGAASGPPSAAGQRRAAAGVEPGERALQGQDALTELA